MRDRMSVPRRIQVRELVIGLSLVSFWTIVMFTWAGDDLAMPFLLATVGGITAVEVGRRIADLAMPGLPRHYRRPRKAAVVAVLVGLVVARTYGTLDPYVSGPFVDGVSPRHYLLDFLLAFAATGFAFALWPPEILPAARTKAVADSATGTGRSA